MMVMIVAITADSLVGIVADFTEPLSSRNGVFVFIAITVILAITQYFILDYVKQSNKETRKRVFGLQKFHTSVTVAPLHGNHNESKSFS
jgi:hypothetical protein